MSTDSILQKHLQLSSYTAIRNHQECLEEGGATYRYNGSIWNIKVGFKREDGSDDVTAIFVRMYSSHAVHGWRFNELPNGYVRRSGVECKGDITVTAEPTEDPKNPSTIFPFISALNDGERIESPQVPILSLENWSFQQAQDFFSEYPQLLPNRIEPPVEDRSNNNNFLFYTIGGFVALCIVSVIAYQYMQNESQTLEVAHT